MLPAGLVWLKDQHVRVDFFYAKQSARVKNTVDVIGNLLFALPFFFLIIPSSIDFAQRALSSGEGSRNSGLNDLWVIKSVLPMGAVGNKLVEKWSQLKIGTGTVHILTPTQMVMDRLAAYFNWNDPQSLDQAVWIAEEHI